jgi:hypothetical protein
MNWAMSSGILGGFVILALAFCFVSTLYAANSTVYNSQHCPWKRVLACFYGGIAEELLLRLFLMTLMAWVFWKMGLREGNTRTACVLASDRTFCLSVWGCPSASRCNFVVVDPNCHYPNDGAELSNGNSIWLSLLAVGVGIRHAVSFLCRYRAACHRRKLKHLSHQTRFLYRSLSLMAHTELHSNILVQTDRETRGCGDAQKMNVLGMNAT